MRYFVILGILTSFYFILEPSFFGLNKESNAQQTIPCDVPLSGDWAVTSDCVLIFSKIAPENVWIQNNSVVTIPNGVFLGIDFEHFNLSVFSGSGLLIQSGGALKQREFKLEETFSSCSSGWYITGYHTPVEFDYSGEFTPIQINGDTREFRKDFVDSVRINGWGKTIAGDYLGWYGNSFHLGANALDANGNVLSVGMVAIDPLIIEPNSNLIIPTLPEPWNGIIFLSSDEGGSIIGKHIDVFTGEGFAASQETYRITSTNNSVCQ